MLHQMACGRNGRTAEGTIGWPGYPNRQPSTIRFYSNRRPGVWHEPRWTEVWFPDAFSGPMAELMDAITENRIRLTVVQTTLDNGSRGCLLPVATGAPPVR